jgi:acid phosphatase (class A)
MIRLQSSSRHLHLRAVSLAGAAILSAALLGACSTPGANVVAPPPSDATVVGEVRAGTGILRGYLAPEQLPDSLALLPPAPDPKSARSAADVEVFKSMPGESDAARWSLAARDADLSFPAGVQSFGDVLGITIDAGATPHLAMLLRRSLTDAGLATYRAKDRYKRQRPYDARKLPTCYPRDEERARTDGSYPSGHASIGWAFALILTEIAPDKADALLARGYEFGQSRVVCRYHWQSDVDAGRLVGSAVFARLQADSVFRAQLELARSEVQAARAAAVQ